MGEPERDAAAHAALEERGVLFDLHAAAAAVAVLPAGELAGHEVGVDPEARRHPFQNRRQARPVGLAGRRQAQGHAGESSRGLSRRPGRTLSPRCAATPRATGAARRGARAGGSGRFPGASPAARASGSARPRRGSSRRAGRRRRGRAPTCCAKRADPGLVGRLGEHGLVEGAPGGHARPGQRVDLGGVRLQDSADLELLGVGEVEGPGDAREHPRRPVGPCGEARAHLAAEEPAGEEAAEGQDARLRRRSVPERRTSRCSSDTPCSSLVNERAAPKITSAGTG